MLVLLACAAPGPVSGDPPEDRPDTAAAAVPPGLEGLAELGAADVVVVHADTLRHDRLPMYGSDHDTLPLTGGLPWLVVDGLHAEGSWTIPSTVSLLTGLAPHHHGVTHMGADASYPPLPTPSLAGVLGQAGFATGAFSGNRAVGQVPGVYGEFDVSAVTEADDAGAADLAALGADTLAWIDTLAADQRFFAFLQPMDVHGPYRVEAPWFGTWSDPDALPFDPGDDTEDQLADFRAAWAAADEAERTRIQAQLDALYDEQILALDAGLAALLDGLAARGRTDVLVVLTADHGETLNEEPATTDGSAYFGHGSTARPELLAIPWLLLHPRIPAATDACLGSNTDVLPTILAAVAVDTPEGLDGARSCRSHVHGGTWLAMVDEARPVELTVTDGAHLLRWQCMLHTSRRYDLGADPDAVVDVPAEDFAANEGLLAEMAAWQAEQIAALGESAACGVE